MGDSAELQRSEAYDMVAPSVFTAFDGEKLHEYWFDECGKTEEMAASAAWRVHKQCLRVRDKIVGKAMLSTTVEETTRGGLFEFIKLWKQSSREPTKMMGGQTASGLVCYARLAPETFKFDQYGHSIIGDPLPYQAEWLKKNKDPNWSKGGKELVDFEIMSKTDPTERAKQMRMYPRSIREALRPSNNECMFNEVIIDTRLDKFLFENSEVIGVNFSWKNGVQDSEVVYEVLHGDDEKARWKFKKSLWEHLVKRSNKNTIINGRRVPANKGMGCVGADPYKFDQVEEERKSLGTAHGYINFIPDIEEESTEEEDITDDLFFEYGYRHPSKEMYGEDMILCCVFLGIEMFPEVNLPFLWDYFVRRGYSDYLKYRKVYKKLSARGKIIEAQTPGASTNSGMKDQMFTCTEAYIKRSGHRCCFEGFLKDCKQVSRELLSPWDFFVSGSYAILACKYELSKPKSDKPVVSNFTGLYQPRLVG